MSTDADSGTPEASDPNPYAPPKTEPALDALDGARAKRLPFASERRSVFVMLLLYLITLGIYPSFWYLRRQPFIDALHVGPTTTLGPTLPKVYLGAQLLYLVGVFGLTMANIKSDLARPMGTAIGVLGIVCAFRVTEGLRAAYARKNIDGGVSKVAAFFFGPLYLQHKINFAAAVIDARPRKARKRRKDA